MKKLLTGILLLSLSTLMLAEDIDMNKSKGTEQSIIVSLTPSVAQMDVDKNVLVKVVFDVDLEAKHVKKNNIKLKKISDKKKKIKGKIDYLINEKSIMFIPNELLEDGFYEIEFKSLKTTKENKHIKIKEIKYRFYVPEVINGYKLPPEPNPAINNATLLGVDSNTNGVRDDVERKIIMKYVKPIEIELMMSYAKTHQEMLNNPISSATEYEKKMSRVIDCRMYLKRQGVRVNSIVDFTENNMYNTKERVKSYLDFNQALSGGVYGSGPADWNAKACDFDIEQMLKDRK